MDDCKTSLDWFTKALPSIYWYSVLNAKLHNRKEVSCNDILLSIKLYKYGYDGFYPPDIVLSVYEQVFKKPGEKYVYNSSIIEQ